MGVSPPSAVWVAGDCTSSGNDPAPGAGQDWNGTAGVGPLIQRCAVVAFDLAIGLWPVGAGVLEADASPAAVSVKTTASV
jgi:hypothetical protein